MYRCHHRSRRTHDSGSFAESGTFALGCPRTCFRRFLFISVVGLGYPPLLASPRICLVGCARSHFIVLHRGCHSLTEPGNRAGRGIRRYRHRGVSVLARQVPKFPRPTCARALLVGSQDEIWAGRHELRLQLRHQWFSPRLRAFPHPLPQLRFSEPRMDHTRLKRPNHALQRTRPSRRGCNRAPSWAGSLSLGR